jgi:hypothetical protein
VVDGLQGGQQQQQQQQPLLVLNKACLLRCLCVKRPTTKHGVQYCVVSYCSPLTVPAHSCQLLPASSLTASPLTLSPSLLCAFQPPALPPPPFRSKGTHCTPAPLHHHPFTLPSLWKRGLPSDFITPLPAAAAAAAAAQACQHHLLRSHNQIKQEGSATAASCRQKPDSAVVAGCLKLSRACTVVTVEASSPTTVHQPAITTTPQCTFPYL